MKTTCSEEGIDKKTDNRIIAWFYYSVLILRSPKEKSSKSSNKYYRCLWDVGKLKKQVVLLGHSIGSTCRVLLTYKMGKLCANVSKKPYNARSTYGKLLMDKSVSLTCEILSQINE